MQTYRKQVASPLPLNYYLGTSADAGIESLLIDDLNPFQACEQGSFTHVSAFLLGGVDPNTSNMRGVSLLHYAAKAGHELIVRFLIDNGALINAQDNDGFTPLMYACLAGACDTIKMLVEARADTGLRCRLGYSCYYYAASFPMALHFLTMAEPMGEGQVAEEEILHMVSGKHGGRFAALYLIEQQGADPNTRSRTGTGGTPLHAAALTGDLDLVKALVSKGADATITDGMGVRPGNVKGCTADIAKWLRSYLAEASTSRRQQLALPDFTNWKTITNLRELRSCLFYLTVPHWAIVVGTYVHPFFSLLCFFCTLTVFGSVAQFSLKQKNRSVVTAAFYFGGMIIGLTQFYTKVSPMFNEDNPGSLCTPLATVFIAIAMYSYVKAVLADPGCAQSTAEQRRDFYTVCHRAGEREHFDQTAMVRKPLRSKHCSKTHQCVKRFDHYCVWTGNAVGAGNHRYFMLFCLGSVIGHAFLTREVVYYYLNGGSARDTVAIDGFSGLIAYLASDANIVVSYFCIFYNVFVIMFTGVMSATQLGMITRNVTSNEEWFAQRYSWMFTLGGSKYSMFDEGRWANFKNFWFGDLGAEVYANPKMSDYLQGKVKAFSAEVRRAQGVEATESTPFNAAAASLANTHHQPSVQPQQQPQSQIQIAAQQSAVTIDQIPQNKQAEIKAIQNLFTQLLHGATDPQIPTEMCIPDDRVQPCISQARAMLVKYRERMNGIQRVQDTPSVAGDRKTN